MQPPHFPHWIHCWYKSLGDTSVQFGLAIIAHLLCYCDKDRGVFSSLALHFLTLPRNYHEGTIEKAESFMKLHKTFQLTLKIPFDVDNTLQNCTFTSGVCNLIYAIINDR